MATSTRYYVSFQARAGRVGARKPWWYVIDSRTEKPVRPQGAHQDEIYDGRDAKRFAERLNAEEGQS